MYSKYQLYKKWSIALGAVALMGLFFSTSYNAQIKQSVRRFSVKNWRAPANYSYQAEAIIKPVSIESEYYRYLFGNDDRRLQELRERTQVWQQNEEFVQMWGLEGIGIYDSTSEHDKQEFVKNHLLDHLRDKVRDPLKADLKDWWSETRSSWEEELFGDNSVDSVGLVSVSTTDKKKPQNKTQEQSPTKFHLKARVLRGQLSARVESPYIDANATVNASGSGEVNLRKKFKGMRLSTLVNYEIDTGNYRAEVNKRIFNTRLNAQIRTQGGRDLASDSTIGVFYNRRF